MDNIDIEKMALKQHIANQRLKIKALLQEIEEYKKKYGPIPPLKGE